MNVIIVGAGPAGASLALLLARHGIEVALIERETDFERIFRGEGLMPSGLDALHQMGFRERLDTLPGRYLESWEVYLDRTRIMRVQEPSKTLGELALRVVSQAALLELITSEAATQPTFSFHQGMTVRELLVEGDRVQGVRATTRDAEVTLTADLVIGCDGRTSTVRRRAGIDLRLLPESYDILWFKLPVPPELEGRCPIQIYASGPDAALGYISWDQRLQLAWMLPKGAWRELRQGDWLVECAKLFPAWLADHVLDHHKVIEGPVRLDVMVGRCQSWHVPGLLLLGDAAHPMSPIRAQGINMALRDAIVAANHLVPALRCGDELDQALVAIRKEREREIVKIQRLQLREVRGQRWARQRPWLMRPLLKLVPLLTRTGFVQRSWLRQQRRLRFGTVEVKLRAGLS